MTTCACGSDFIEARSFVATEDDLPYWLPKSRITSYPAEVWDYACLCGREEVFVRGPSGGVQYSRVYPKGRWCEVIAP